MKSVILWLLGVPIVVIILLNAFETSRAFCAAGEMMRFRSVAKHPRHIASGTRGRRCRFGRYMQNAMEDGGGDWGGDGG